MMCEFVPEYEAWLRTATVQDVEREAYHPKRLLLAEEQSAKHHLQVAYAPFEYINPAARIIIVGITPGRSQMLKSLLLYRANIRDGVDPDIASKAAKESASFAGPMRTNLVALLDFIGLNKWLRIPTTASLWKGDLQLAHFTSALRYPTFRNGENYNASPKILSSDFLTRQVEQWLVEDLKTLPDAVVVPLGDNAASAVLHASKCCGFPVEQVLSGLPHPSGANAERIQYFLGRKPAEQLSEKTDRTKLDFFRGEVLGKVEGLLALSC